MKLWMRNHSLTFLGFVFACLITISVIFYAIFNLNTLDNNTTLVNHTLKVLAKIDETLALITDAESSQRGYIITGDPAYLEPYYAALSMQSGVKQHIEQLRQLTSKNLQQQTRLDKLDALVDKKLEFLAETIQTRKDSGLVSAQELIQTDQSKLVMDEIRALLGEMHQEEAALLTGRANAAAASLTYTGAALAAGILLSFSLLGVSFYQAQKQIKEGKQAEQATRLLNEELEERVRQRTAELVSANETLQTSENRLKNTLNIMLEGCQVITFDWRYEYINEAAARHGKTTVEQLLGKTMMECYPGIENTPAFNTFRLCMQQRVSRRMENPFTYPDGSRRWYELSIQPAPEGIFILSIDITEKKEAEIEAHRQLERLRGLREIDLAIISSTDIYLALRTVLEEVLAQLKVDAVSILFLNPTTQMLKFFIGRGFHGKGIEQSELRLGQGIAGKAALEHSIQRQPSFDQNHERFVRWKLIQNEGFVDYYVIPLVAKGNTLGVLEVFHRQPLPLDENDLDFLNALAGQTAIAIDNQQLFSNLRRANMDLLQAYDTTIEGWSHALDLRDKETEGHTLRVTEWTLQLASAAGIREEELIHIRRGALLHDIGKMGVPDHILLKPGSLNEEEWKMMRMHPVFAYELLSPIPYLRPALDIPYCHHEKWDGTGYPRGLKGESIPAAARLFAVVDIWDGLRSDRPYRPAWDEARTLEYIQSISGSHLEPRSVDLFMKLRKQGAFNR